MNLYRTKFVSTMSRTFVGKIRDHVQVPESTFVVVLTGNSNRISGYMTLLTEYGILYTWHNMVELLGHL